MSKSKVSALRFGLIALAALIPLGWALWKANAVTTRTWDGGGANNFLKTANNWQGNVAPLAGDDLVFPAGTPRLTPANDYDPGTIFNSISFTGAGGGYFIFSNTSSNTISLNQGINASNTAGSNSIGMSATIKLNNNQSFTSTVAGTSLTVAGSIDNNGKTLTLDGDGAIIISAGIGGSGGVTKSGANTTTFTGGNSYTGPTNVLNGTLLVNGSQTSSNVNINGGSLGGTGTVGTTSLGLGSINPGGAGTGTGILNSGALTLGILGDGGYVYVDLKGTTAGTSYDQLNVSGAVTIDSGSLNVTLGSGFTPAPGDTFIIINNDSTDAIAGSKGTFHGLPEGSSFTVGGTTFVISYTGGNGNDIVLHVPTTRTWDGRKDDGSASADNKWSTKENWVGDVAPAAGDSLEFPATAVQKTNTNDLPGGMTFSSITLSGAGYGLAGNSIGLNAGITETVSSGNDNTVSVPIKLNANQTITTAGPTGRRLTIKGGIDTNGRILALDGSGPCNFDGLPITGGGGINRMGTGLSVLIVNNTYTGVTTISSGRLGIQGNQPNSMVSVTGGTLQGSGTTGPVNASSGKVAPGGFSFPPALTVQGSLTFSSNSTFETAVQGSAPNREFGRLNVNGPVDLGGAALSVIPNLPLPTGNSFIIVNNDGADAVVGTFNGLPEGSVVTAGSQQFTISYVGGDGNNDVVLTALPPTLFIEEGTTNRAVALDSVTFVRGPFRVIDDHNFSADHRTRLILFTSLLSLTQPDPSVLVVQAGGFNLPVENVGTLTAQGLVYSFVVVRLPEGLPPGDLPMAFTLRGVMSNTAILSIVP